MEQKTPKEIANLLAQPFAPEDLEWRLQRTFQDSMSGIAVPYLNNRAIQNRLDEVVGPENWKNEYRPWQGDSKKGSQLCGISIYYEGREWITKWDGAENTEIEPVKGGLSDSMKRAAVQWGIGRALYSMDTVWVSVERKGKSFIIPDSERGKLNAKYLDMLEKLGLTHSQPTGVEAQLTPYAELHPMQPQSLQQPQNHPPRQAQPKQFRSPPPPRNHPPMQQNAAWPPPQFQGKPLPKGNQPLPAYEFMVTDMKTQPGMHGNSAALELTNPQGQKLLVYHNGPMPNVVPGTPLVGVGYRTETQGNVVFHILERYQILSPMPQNVA